MTLKGTWKLLPGIAVLAIATPAVWARQDPGAMAAAQADAARASAIAQQAEVGALQGGVQRGQWIGDLDDMGGGWLGVGLGEVTPDRMRELKLPAERGVYIESVAPGSPADKAGLKKGDVVETYDQQNVEGTLQFTRLVRETPPGRTVQLGIWRDGRAQQLSVQIGKQEDREDARAFLMQPRMPMMDHPNMRFHFDFPGMPDFGSPRLGINAEDLSGQLGSYFGAPQGKGVLVVEVFPNSAAEKAGLKAGDVIISVDGKSVTETSQLRDEIDSRTGGGEVTLGILRREKNMTIRVQMPKPVESPEMSPPISL